MAAESLEAALRQAGREDRVACHRDNLAVGPIDRPDAQARAVWMDRELPVAEPNEERFPEDAAFWHEALRGDVRKVAWMSRRSAPEYCAFLEWLWRLGEQPCEVIDLTDMPVGSRRRVFLLGLLDAEEIADNRLWDRAVSLAAAARERYHGLWRQLRAENAPLRVVDGGGLRSAPITFFDQQLLSFAKPSWQRACDW